MTTLNPAAYEALASEYYDSTWHPTCANFRYASCLLIKPWLEKFANDRPVCEIGAGMSIAAELLAESNSSLSNLYLTDSVQSMLEHSLKWEAARPRAFVAEAGNLPFEPNIFGLCISSLGDPYNTGELWEELARVLSGDGYAIFTTPSYEWASRYRKTISDSLCELAAEFRLSDGRIIFAPSVIYNYGDQVKLIEASRGMEVIDFQRVRYSQLPPDNISPKLLVAQENDLPIVSGYLVRRS
jgi:SAM-dependent methyltransferase